jgi:hypothetical protein
LDTLQKLRTLCVRLRETKTASLMRLKNDFCSCFARSLTQANSLSSKLWQSCRMRWSTRVFCFFAMSGSSVFVRFEMNEGGKVFFSQWDLEAGELWFRGVSMPVGLVMVVS